MYKMNITMETIGKLNGLGNSPPVLRSKIDRNQNIVKSVRHRHQFLQLVSNGYHYYFYLRALSQRKQRFKVPLLYTFIGNLLQQFIRRTESHTFTGISNYAPVVLIVADRYTILHGNVVLFAHMLQRIGFTKRMSANTIRRSEKIRWKVHFSRCLTIKEFELMCHRKIGTYLLLYVIRD